MTSPTSRRFEGLTGPLALVVALTTAIAALAAFPRPAAAAGTAVVIMYHRFGEETLPSTNIRLDQFESHIEELRTGGYAVLPLPQIIAALKQGSALPDRAVAITIDDAYRSVYDQAWPRLKAAGLPFTLFVSTDVIDAGLSGMMTWAQIRELAADGVTIGHHSAAHAHMAYREAQTNAADTAKATRRFIEELGDGPRIYAYPYGEYSLELRNAIAATGFDAALGQHSGGLYVGADLFSLPRFALNEKYGDIERFRLIARSLPLPATEITPSDPVLGTNPPLFGFTLPADIGNLDQLACFASGQGPTAIERLGERRIEVRLVDPFPPGRARINCTLPGPDGRWRWFGMQFLVPTE